MFRGKRPNNKRPSLITSLLLRSAVARHLDGLWIGSFAKDAELRLDRVEGALNLIKKYDPLRYRRLIRDLERISVAVIPVGIARFDQSTWACVLDERHILNEATSLEGIASSIVHEATHARICRCGIGYGDKELRARVEVACFRRERAFAGTLPNGEQNRELIDRSLQFYRNPELWTNDALRAQEEEGLLKVARYLGLPDWFSNICLQIRSLRAKLSRLTGSSPGR
jgi:hypothetical protein